MARSNGKSLGPIPQHFPQPSRPLHPYDMDHGINLSNRNFDRFNDVQESSRNGYLEQEEEDDSLHSMRGIIRELDEKRHKLLKQFVSKVDKVVPVETLYDFRGSHVSDVLENYLNSGESDDHVTSTERGVDADFSASDGPKLERFRVKTVNIPGVVEEDETDSA